MPTGPEVVGITEGGQVDLSNPGRRLAVCRGVAMLIFGLALDWLVTARERVARVRLRRDRVAPRRPAGVIATGAPGRLTRPRPVAASCSLGTGSMLLG